MTRIPRRAFLAAPFLGALRWTHPARALTAGTSFPVALRKPAPHDALRKFILPGEDEFPEERTAMGIERRLGDAVENGSEIELAPGFEGASPLPAEYPVVVRNGRVTVQEAKYDAGQRDFRGDFAAWRKSLGACSRARFYVLPNNRVRYEITAELSYRVGEWEMQWDGEKLTRFHPGWETLATSSAPLFRDVTGTVLAGVPSMNEQLQRGVPYWRARLDSASGIDIYGSNGIAVGDIDGDGHDEVYVCQPGGLPNRLYKWRANGTFADITAQSGLDVLDDTASALFVDFRNAAVQDAVVLTADGPMYFQNDGKGRFTHREGAFRFATPAQGTFTGMAAADYDRDGRVDLYFCTYVYFQSEDRYRYPVPYHDAQNGPPNYLFRNVADAVFEDVTASTGINQNNNRYSFAPAWCDYDGSGWPSLYVANDFGRNNLYKNEGGKFRDVAAEAGVEDMGPGMSAAWFDADNDGKADLYVANMWTASGQRVASSPEFAPVRDGKLTEAYRGHTKGNSLYRNAGGGKFEENGAAARVEMGRWAWSADGIDFDNDGTPEILVAAGMITNSNPVDLMSFFWRQTVAKSPVDSTPTPAYENGWNALNQFIREEYSWNGNEPNVVFLRDGDRYYDISGISGAGFAADSRAFAATDFDSDGTLDLLVKSRRGPQLHVLQNDCAAGRKSIAVCLRGTKSNRDAIGARVDLQCGNRIITRFLSAGSGYLSQHTKWLHFGLDGAAKADSVTVQWPSGTRQELTNLAAGFRYRIVEGETQPASEPSAPRRELEVKPVRGDNTPAVHPTWLVEPVPLPSRRNKAGFVLLTAGETEAPPGVPVDVVDLRKAPPDEAAGYALFRRYLLDWRADLQVPLLLLVDELGRVHKIYPSVPSRMELRQDLNTMRKPDRLERALPFSGRYYHPPARSHYKLGAAFVGAGYPEQALPYLEEAVRQWPENFKAHLAIGQVYLEMNRAGEARPELELAARLNPRSPEVWNNLGGVAAAAGDHAGALDAYNKALALNANLPWVLANAAQAEVNLNRPAEAEKLFRRALEIDPKDSDTADRLGLLLAQQGRSNDALALFQQALASDRKNVSAINNLGVLYKQLGKDNDALAALLYGMEVAPQDENIAMNLARMYYGAGERDRARVTLERHLEKNPNSAKAKRALQELMK